ncbi:sensor histidine kinase [Paenibacillus sp. NEAU-GSW1]|uniref:sensor histidine kinase n=1 Tax=Paenibacillus sp. NEAU-GSW1 TaxID=2682486 RepID=UPI0012E0DC1E|nr:histidine kinase [Paenibacillus sp. NEAU-GSW1]MUT67121.1 sensor histidine kinase [Paenibacillus sp. NEAU-GSW1]
MSYKWLKLLILWIPTITIGLWEYARHAFLLSYVSMELGNWLAPLIVLVVTLTLLRALFAKMEQTQEALQREQMTKAALEQREQLARELHDGISQSLFLLSVKMERLEQADSEETARRTREQIRGTIKHVYEDVRQSIANLQSDPVAADSSWISAIYPLVEEMKQTSGIKVAIDWRIGDGVLNNKSKIELLAIIREALMNVRKHALATQATVVCEEIGALPPKGETPFRCLIRDNGVGASELSIGAKGNYGIKMMRDRAERMGWSLHVAGESGKGTLVTIESGRQEQ